MSSHLRRLRAALAASLLLSPLFLAGCSDDGTVTIGSTARFVSGNWQISSSAPAAARLSSLSGELSGTASDLTGILHTQAASSCVAPSTSFAVKGAADDKGVVTLSGPLDSGMISITGTLAADGKSITNASYSVSGGSCATSQAVLATAQYFAPVTGTYAGKFSDLDGQVAQVTANFSQSTAPDTNGNFTLAGTASVSNNPCFPTTVPVSNTQVTGGTFTFTYGANGSSVTAVGTFAADANTLTVTSWSSSGTCGADTGAQSTMTRQ